MFWTTTELAQETGITREYISRLCKRGTLKGTKKGHDWIVDDETAQAFIQTYKDKQQSQ